MRKLRKLAAMPPGEIAARLHEAAFARYEKVRFILGMRQPYESDHRSASGDVLRLGRWWIDKESCGRIVAAIGVEGDAYRAQVLRHADRTLAGEYAFFGRTFALGTRPRWQADPVGGGNWPTAFHSDVNIFGGDTGHGDVKYVWELNRFQFLPLLGKAWQLTRNADYARRVVTLLDDWIETNPYKVGINWSSMLELAVRALSWLYGLALIDDSPALDGDARERITRNLLLHGQCIREHLSTYFSPYNHLIGEAAALYALGTVLDTPHAAEWRSTGRSLMVREVARQWYADGGSVEQASGYHYFTLGFYLQALLLARANGDPHDALLEAVERATEFGMHISRPDGLTPMIGDGDEGHALQLLRPDFWDFRAYIAVAAALTDRDDFRTVAGPLPEDAWWLTGAPPDRDRHANAALPPPSTFLASSGYAIMRSDWSPGAHWLLFDCGELADGVRTDDVPSAAHGHADALSIELTAFGQPVFIDPGFYTYNGPISWHTHFRNTDAHNALTVDGLTQAVFRGRLKWSNGPRVRHGGWFTSRAFDYVAGSHDAWHASHGVEHYRRVVFVKPNLWIVRDDVTGEGEHLLTRHWHCTAAPDDLGAGSFRVPVGHGTVTVHACESDSHLSIRRGVNEPDGGWAAVGYETRVDAPYVQVQTRRTLPTVLYTVIAADADASSPWGLTGTGNAIVLTGERDEVVVRFREGDPLNAGLTWHWRHDGRLRSAGVVNGTRIGDETIAIAELRTNGSAGFSSHDGLLLETSTSAEDVLSTLEMSVAARGGAR